MILAIVGSKSLEGSADADGAIEEVLDRLKPKKVVSGGCKGIDRMAVAAAKRRGIDTQEFPPKRHQWAGPGGYRDRNIQVAEACTYLVRIVALNSGTYGSGWTRDYAKKLGKPTEEYVIHE